MSQPSTTEDFGFTFEASDSDAITTAKLSSLTWQQKHDQLLIEFNELVETDRAMYKKILGLLNNLKKSPEKPQIKWPNRVEAINNFIKELDELRVKKKEG